MIDDLVRLVNLGVITIDDIKDASIKTELQAKLAS